MGVVAGAVGAAGAAAEGPRGAPGPAAVGLLPPLLWGRGGGLGLRGGGDGSLGAGSGGSGSRGCSEGCARAGPRCQCDIRVGMRGFEGNKAAPGLLHLLLGGREGMPGVIVVVSEPCG